MEISNETFIDLLRLGTIMLLWTAVALLLMLAVFALTRLVEYIGDVVREAWENRSSFRRRWQNYEAAWNLYRKMLRDVRLDSDGNVILRTALRRKHGANPNPSSFELQEEVRIHLGIL